MSLLQVGSRSETTQESGGVVKGVAIALVTQNKDDEGFCRVKVTYPWRHRPGESYWAPLAVPMAGKDRGLVMIPEVGDQVLVAFEREDLRFPYVLGGLWNGKDRPPINNKDGKNDKRKLVSRSKHFLLFDDGQRGVVQLSHEKGRTILFDEDGFVVKDEKGNMVKVNSGSGEMTIEAKGKLNIKAAMISIEATGTLELNSKGTMKISGSVVNIN